MANHPNRGRVARQRAALVADMRDCATGKPDRIQLWPHECALIVEQLDRIPALEAAARRSTPQ